MFAMNAVRRAAAVAVRAENRRNVASYTDVVAAPPAVRISFIEKLVHGALLSIGFLGYPIYTMFEVAKIKQAEYDALEIPDVWQEWSEKQKK